jgi:hypothetical protein
VKTVKIAKQLGVTCALAVALASASFVAEAAGALTAGSKCTVASGANKGKSGTVTVEADTGSQWCEGSWGATECTGSNKCAASRGVKPSFFLPPNAGTTIAQPTQGGQSGTSGYHINIGLAR